MTDYENVLVDVDGPVATITLNRPEKLNAISGALRDDLEAALRELNPGDAVRVIRLKGAGRAFCAGYDLTPTTGGALNWRPNQRTGDQAWEPGRVTHLARPRRPARECRPLALDVVLSQADHRPGAQLVAWPAAAS